MFLKILSCTLVEKRPLLKAGIIGAHSQLCECMLIAKLDCYIATNVTTKCRGAKQNKAISKLQLLLMKMCSGVSKFQLCNYGV